MKITNKENIQKWTTVVLCCIMIMVALGFGSSTKSLFPDEIAKDLGVSRSLVSLGESCRYIATAVVNIFFSTLILRFGPKKLICAGFISLIAAMILYSYAEGIPLILIAGTLLGVGFSFTTTTMVGYMINLWHTKNKGTITGIVLASNGIGGMIAIKLAGSFINPDITGSYRAAYKLIAYVFAVTLLIMILFLKDRKSNGSKDESSLKSEQKMGGLEFNLLLRKPYFWLSLVCVFLSGLILQGTESISAMHLKDVGIDYSNVKNVLSFGSLFLAFSKLFSGFLYDKRGLRLSATLCSFFAVVSSIVLVMTENNSIGLALAVVYAIISKFASPLCTVMLTIYATDLCGERAYIKALGIYVSVNTVGYAISAPAMNICYDMLGNYNLALYLSAIGMTAVLVILQYVISASHKDQRNLSTV